MADTPLGRGLIEIGANLAPLEKGLAEAQAKTRAALGGAAVGGGATATGGATAVSGTSAIKEEAAAMNAASASTTTYTASKAKAAEQTMGLGKRISESTKGIREFTASITGIAGVFTGLLSVVGLVVGGFTALYAKVKQNREEAKKAHDDYVALTTKLHELQKVAEGGGASILGLDQDQTGNQIRQLQEFYGNLQRTQAQIADIEMKRIDKSNKSESAKQQEIAKLNENLKLKSAEIERNLNEETQKIYQQAYKKSAEEINKFEAETAIRSAKAAGDERKVIDLQAAEQTRQINQQIQETDNEFQQERLRKRLKVVEEERKAEHKKIDERIEKEKEADRKKREQEEKAARKALKAFEEAQKESFAKVQSQINSLFNTGNMEVGINRVAGLIQVLIDKTERG